MEGGFNVGNANDSTQLGPAQYLGVYVNSSLTSASWTNLGSSSFLSAAYSGSSPSAIPINRLFLQIMVMNLGSSPIYMVLDTVPGTGPSNADATLMFLGNTSTLVTVASILPTDTTVRGIRNISIRGDFPNGVASYCRLQAAFTTAYGP